MNLAGEKMTDKPVYRQIGVFFFFFLIKERSPFLFPSVLFPPLLSLSSPCQFLLLMDPPSIKDGSTITAGRGFNGFSSIRTVRVLFSYLTVQLFQWNEYKRQSIQNKWKPCVWAKVTPLPFFHHLLSLLAPPINIIFQHSPKQFSKVNMDKTFS